MDIILIALGIGIVCFVCGRYSRKTVTVSDVLEYKPSNRSEKQRKIDGVMQLSNELVNSGAVKMIQTDNNGYIVKITVVV